MDVRNPPAFPCFKAWPEQCPCAHDRALAIVDGETCPWTTPAVDREAVKRAVGYRMQAAWEPEHERVVSTVLAVLESGEWREFQGD